MRSNRPLLFADEEQAAKATRDSVAPVERSLAAQETVFSKRFPDETPVHSIRTLWS